MNKTIAFIIKYKWFILVIMILLPFIINLIMGNVMSTGALASVYVEYIGVIISSLLAFVILFKQLEENHKENELTRERNREENENNRKLQTDILNYQQEKVWLDDLRKASVDLLKAMNLVGIMNLRACIMSYYNQEPHSIDDKNILLKEILEISNRITVASYNFSILISMKKNNDIKIKRLLDRLQFIINEYNLFFADLNWLVLNVSKDGYCVSIPFRNNLQKAASKYKSDSIEIGEVSESERIYYYLEQYKYDFKNKNSDIILDRFTDFMEKVNYEELNVEIFASIINIELENIEKKYHLYNN